MIADFDVVAARIPLIQRIPNPPHSTTVAGSLSFAILSGYPLSAQEVQGNYATGPDKVNIEQ